MKIKLDFPDSLLEDFKERTLMVFAGIEMIAFKNRGDRWKIKTSSCVMCGKCCKDLKKEHPFPVINGQCIYLVNPPGYGDKWICGLRISRPFNCAISNTTAKYCKVKYKYIEE